ncbi:MAG: hypothetical protein RPU39_17890 [Candidatus Sedimenticola sp. (ex Thyasira tokunagai)]
MMVKESAWHIRNIAALVFLHFCLTAPASAEIVRICDDEAGWSPFVYNPIVDEKPDRSKIERATVELVLKTYFNT